MTTDLVHARIIRDVRALHHHRRYHKAALRAAQSLSHLDPATVQADAGLLELALLYTDSAVHATPTDPPRRRSPRSGRRLPHSIGDAGRPVPAIDTQAALEWARYAHATALRSEVAGPAQLAAATEAVAVLAHRLDRHHEAITFAGRLLAFQREHGDVDDVIRARLLLGAYLHADGSCAEGTTLATDAWQSWKDTYGDPRENVAALTVAVQLVSLLMACGRAADAMSALREVTEPADAVDWRYIAHVRNFLDRLEPLRLRHASVHHDAATVAIAAGREPDGR
ncbi:hypothetical protein SAMN05421812_13611 [Asanoa hainanensis]|uniref:Tetratricopeptide repeat-containing protein n=1 Tax=Asanoa hainanensis TaxID=560556 RepID=A0A239PI38_9ACTN|nr:hypothetical protein [Asanoa hainanensis]SNT66264.1 hypothetical protein SAMN05421812_13611 [Asanoa hainanensis]